MTGDLGERISSLESLTARNATAHERMSDKMDTLLNVTVKISSAQDNIALSLTNMGDSINRHDDRIRSLENTRLSKEASDTMLRRVVYIGWTALLASAGFFGFHFLNPPPGSPPH